jgi:preprotein translocase subunit SecA
MLEGRDLEGIVMDMIEQSIDDACASYLDGQYAHRCIAEWAGANLQLPVRQDQIKAESPEELPNLEDDLRHRAKEEARSEIAKTIGEYMDSDLDHKDWDLRGLSGWAMSRFNVNLSQNQLRKMDAQEVEAALSAAAAEKIDQFDLSPLGQFLQPTLARDALAAWAMGKFSISVSGEELTGEADAPRDVLLEKVTAAYRRREVEYPVEYAMEMTVVAAGTTENIYAINNLVAWANRKYDARLSVDDFRDRKVEEIKGRLLELSREWSDDGRLERAVEEGLGTARTVAAAIEFAENRFDTRLKAEDFDSDIVGRLVEAGRAFLRREMTELERYVLLQIYDTAWIDHLLAMDHLKSGIGLRSYAEQDPRVAYKREGARLYQEMHAAVCDRVTDMIFKVRLTAGTELRSSYRINNVVHEQLAGYDRFTREADQQAAAMPQKVATIVREVPRVGRNDLCPCGSGKKYKKCCGKGLG